MPRYATVYKNVGETPLQAIEKFRLERGISAATPLAYAGRLDPMADGKLLILIGDECKRQKEYHSLDKEYTFRVLLGFKSDTQDILGLAEQVTTLSRCHLDKVVEKLNGEITLPYPNFSAKTVRGKPLHMHTLENTIASHEIPTKTSTVYRLELKQIENWEREKISTEIFSRIDSFPEVTDPRKALGQDFRRTEIRAKWNELFDSTGCPEEFQVATFHCICSSGTYMRTLSDQMDGLALSITRTKMGRYVSLPFDLDFWLYSF